MTPKEPQTEVVIVERVKARVHERLPDVSLETIEAEVTVLFQQFADCKVRTYLPILVEHDAIERLRRSPTSKVA